MFGLISTLYDIRALIEQHIANPILRFGLNLLVMVVIVVVLRCLWRMVYHKVRAHLTQRGWAVIPLNLLFESKLLPRLYHLILAVVCGCLISILFDRNGIREFLLLVTRCYFYFICAKSVSALLTFIYTVNNWKHGVAASPLKGLFQVVKIFGYCVAIVTILATLIGKDPTYIVSGMTALSAVLMLIFKDSILGLTAGVTLAGNEMIRIGDWIEVPGANADGDVIDIALTTVRVQNWDKTITSVPAYDLLSKPFKNWRGMSDSGGRRIKRSILIDLDSVAFVEEEMLEKWKEIDLLRDYLAGKINEVRAYNLDHPSSKVSVVNARKLTNIGTFRAYCEAYLRHHTKIHQGMTLLVRQLQPHDNGLPLEIYCFTNTTAWSEYEGIQSDIFDHLLAIMPEFGLTCFQGISASAMRAISLR